MSQYDNPEANESQAERSYENNEIFALANKGCLIAFNNLMKNIAIESNPEARKSLAKKNKIQVAYVDRSSKGSNGKHPKHDFFVDPDEMKYFIEGVYESIINPDLPSTVRKQGHKFMGGTKTPCVSNIITFKFLTKEEMTGDSSPNSKILKKYEEDKQKYSNAMLDWKNLQVARLVFEKQEGRIMGGGLIVPTGKQIPGLNFKPYFITMKDLLELCVTVRDAIRTTETMYSFEVKMLEFQKNILSQVGGIVENSVGKAVSKLNTYASGNSQASVQSNNIPNNVNRNSNNNGNSDNKSPSTPSVTETPSPSASELAAVEEARNQRTKAQAQWLIDTAKPIFISSFQDEQLANFIGCLVIEQVSFDNNILNIQLKFQSSMYDINDFKNSKQLYNQYYKRCLDKILKDNEKSYQVQINQF